jgi:hypothetical protein
VQIRGVSLLLVVAALGLAPVAAHGQAFAPWYERDDTGVEAQALVGVQLLPGAASDFLGSGVAYGVAVTIEPFPIAALELGYQGGFYRSVALPGVAATELSVFENGGYAAAKASPLAGSLEPYLLVGVGFSSVEVVEEEGAVSDLADDTLVLLPLALGADFHFLDESTDDPGEAHLTVGLRASWQFVFDNEFVPVTARGADRLTLSAVLGAQF